MAAGLHLQFHDKRAAQLVLPQGGGGGGEGERRAGGAGGCQAGAAGDLAGRDPGLSHLPLHSVCKMLIGSARSMGVTVEMGREQEQ